MARSKSQITLMGSVMWIVGFLVSLAVGFGMAARDPTLTVPFIPVIVTQIAGWIVVIGTVLGALMSLMDVMNR